MQTYVAVRQTDEVRYAATAVFEERGEKPRKTAAQRGEQTSCDVVEAGRETGSSAIVFHGPRLRETSSDVGSQNCSWLLV